MIKPATFYLLFILSCFTLCMFSVSSVAQKHQATLAPEIIEMETNASGKAIELYFIKGSGHNKPTFAIWTEDLDGELIETLFVTKYFATGIYGYADAKNGTWKDEPGESIRPAALPYWSHKRNVVSRDSLYIPTPENPLPDAITGATPQGNFVLKTKLARIPRGRFKILLEVNQTWDWNEYWTNNKYPGNKEYESSAQPSVIYSATIDLSEPEQVFKLKPIGHGHYSGDDGQLYNDLSTFTTALKIAEEITVTIP